jgi:DNA (cytosine-5)-methyltransferase 1|tara:strand:+ start:530 stop:2152 length:1623 start_codon:yes stop_codon:yes gene_type:complete
MIVDLFAGGGGASTGIEMGLNRPVDIAINHDTDAISMHAMNHPGADHYQSDVFEVDPLQATNGRPVGHFHASPDCTHHSQARAGQPRKKALRSLSWVVHKWAGKVQPRVITLENVEAMLHWSPLVAKRCKETGRVIKVDGAVAAPGERVPCQEQFLIPDKRRKGHNWRHFVQGLRDMGYDVQFRTLRACDFGAPTRRERLFLIARRDGQPIVWPKPTHAAKPKKGQYAFRTAADCIDWSIRARSIFGRKRPLANPTHRRIARSIQRFVLDPSERYVLAANDARCSATSTAQTIMQNGESLAGAGSLIQTGYGERKGQSPRVLDLRKPLGTVVAGGVKHAIVTACMAQMNGGYNNTPGHAMGRPMSTICGRGTQQQLVTANLVTLRQNSTGIAATDPLPTVCAGGLHHALVECTLSPSSEAAALQVADFLIANGDFDASIGMSRADKLKLVTVHHEGNVYVIVDIGLRMLESRELYRAQGFPDSYVIDRGHDGRTLNKTAQTRMVGNSVSPMPMAAIVRANHRDIAAETAPQINTASAAYA